VAVWAEETERQARPQGPQVTGAIAICVARGRIAALLIASLTIAAALYTAVGSRAVSAHANLLRSSPAAGDALQTAPNRVIIWFTEPIEPAFSDISVIAADGSRVESGAARGDPTEPTALMAELPELPDGTYTVAWRNVSTVDGHAIRGSFSFSIGEAAPVQEAPLGAPVVQSKVDPWQRWVLFLGAALIVGALAFELVVLSPALGEHDLELPPGRAASSVSGWLVRILSVGFALAALGMAGQLAQQVSLATGEPLYRVPVSAALNVLSDSSWGRLWAGRTILFAVAAVCVWAAARARRDQVDSPVPGLLSDSPFTGVAMALGVGALGATTLMSHSAAVPADVRWPTVANDFLHITAASAWAGGVICMALVMPVLLKAPAGQERRDTLSALVQRFTTLALMSAGAVAITGIFSGWMHVTVPSAVKSPYGWALVAKIALLAPLFAVAAVNSYIVRPRLAADDTAGRRLRRLVTAEAALFALVLLAVGWLASMEPARQYASRAQAALPKEARYETEAEGARLDITVTPVEPGYNLIVVRIRDRKGDPVTDATEVRARLVYRGEDLGAEFISGLNHGDGLWIVHGAPMNVAGAWQAEVIVIRPGAFDAHASFAFDLLAGGSATEQIRPTQRATLVLFGGEIALLGALVVAIGAPYRHSARRTALAFAAPGLVAVVAGLSMAAVVLAAGGDSASAASNPVLPTQASVDNGRTAYAARCAQCHGETGAGDGPDAAALARKPADLVIHVPLHPDKKLFEFIRDGIPASGMPGQAATLSDQQMWDLVNYLKTFSQAK
jgi:copper transport protein